MVIITGANGFVGQRLCQEILKRYRKSEIFCLVGTGKSPLDRAGIKLIKKLGLKYLVVDLVTKKNLDKVPKSPPVVIHLAANTDTARPDHRVNDIGTKNLLEAISPLDKDTHIIYTGTTVLFSGRQNPSVPITEVTRVAPTNEYGRSKLRAEEILTAQARKHKFRLTILRLNTVYGGDPREFKMFKVLKRNIQEGSLTARLNWPGKTSLIHVKDVVVAIMRVSRRKPHPGKPVLCLVHADNPSLKEISKVMHQEMGLDYQPITLPKIVWRLMSFSRIFIPMFEKLIPLSFYNQFWRLSLIVDDVINCRSRRAAKLLAPWKPRKFDKGVKDEIID